MVRLIAPLVLIGSLAASADAQSTRLTPQVVQEILTLAEQARTETFGASLEAVRVFRRAILDKYQLFHPCSPSSGEFFECFYGPKSWYAEQLAQALGDGKSLTTVEARDEIVIVIVPRGKSAVPPETVTITQGLHIESQLRVITPFERTTPAIEVKDTDGTVVKRAGSAFHVRADDLDLHSNGVLISWGERPVSVVSYSAGVLEDAVRLR